MRKKTEAKLKGELESEEEDEEEDSPGEEESLNWSDLFLNQFILTLGNTLEASLHVYTGWQHIICSPLVKSMPANQKSSGHLFS